MAWNKPGGEGDNQDPWGSNNKNQGPPDLDKLLGQLIDKLRSVLNIKMKKPGDRQPTNNQPTNKELGFGAGLVAGVILIAWMLSGLFIVNPAEQAVILRFGQYADTMNPGLHWMARFIDTKYMVDVQKINSFALQGNFLTKSSEQGDLPNQVIPVKTKSANSIDPDSSDKSKNLVDVEMTVQYRISDPRDYLFNVVNPDNTIQEVAAGALSDVVGRMKLDDVLTTGREMLSSAVLERTKLVLTGYHAGLEVTAVTLRRVTAPQQVQAAFNDVNRADQDKATYIQQAQAYASKVVPLAQGVAARITADANAYQQQTVLLAQAQVAKYQALLSVYKSSPDLTRERIYLETMQMIMQSTSKILVDGTAGSNLLNLPLASIMKTDQQDVPASDAAADQTYSYLASRLLPATAIQSAASPEQSDGTEDK
jgi:membrane protease subunit HflK